MVPLTLRPGAILEIAVLLLQVTGLVSLCLSRILSSSRWSERARGVFLVTLIGLGIAGALCTRFDSKFALFAGATMTFLLIGMIWGNGQADPIVNARTRLGAEA